MQTNTKIKLAVIGGSGAYNAATAHNFYTAANSTTLSGTNTFSILNSYVDVKSNDIRLNNTASWTSGTGSPEGVLTKPVGSLYSRTDGGANTTLYVKESGAGNTGWVAK